MFCYSIYIFCYESKSPAIVYYILSHHNKFTMKDMNQLKKLTILSGLLLTLFVGFSCGSDDEEMGNPKLMNSWQLISETKDGTVVDLSECELGELVCFSTQNVCFMYLPCKDEKSQDVRTAWNYDSKSQVLNISSLLPVTFYVEKVDSDLLVLKYYDYSESGVLEKYIREYKAVLTTITNDKLRLK